ncbi:ABC transporter ATP-binding protein [Dickeya zeae]|uniref:ABC transporter ATP-binding protein n=1 Tax=Dickeya zeae TaxID=204042 RepID=UPI0003A0C49E|nr:ABC transporter ATP-binding protein [Dickeya zeae]
MPMISISGLNKAYKMYPTRWSRLVEWISPFNIKRHELKWVLKDINFDIHAGESVGIIGSNGAGKSTLLKIITGTTTGTNGSVSVSGRISALLELGIGFHPDFTGRQNVYMSGQLLGISHNEINALMSEIESFAEIGDYIDQPVRVYSSGMQVRLAFSLATAVRPDILIVDEALAVGDIFFQQKCFDRIFDMKQKGTTLLFVTHDMGSIYRLCDKALYIDHGVVKAFGDVRETIARYELDLKKIKKESNDEEDLSQSNDSLAVQYDESVFSPPVQFISSQIFCGGVATDSIDEGAEFSIAVEIEKIGNISDDLHIGFQIRDAKGNIYFETNTYCQKISPVHEGNYFKSVFHLTNNLCQGTYILSFGVASDGYGLSSFRDVLLHDVGRKKFSVIRNVDRSWAGLCNMRVHS